MNVDCRNSVIVRSLPHQEYESCAEAMRSFTDARTPDTPDEIWLLQHDPVLTQGQAGKAEHVLSPGDIPVVQSDRGGQVTYHGPGQLVAYLLIDIRRKGMNVRDLVTTIEDSIIELLDGYGIEATTRPGAPGVYTGNAKIAFLGLRVRRGCSYHGLSLNVDMDLEPFSRINPCGFQGLDVTQLRDLGVDEDIGVVAGRLRSILARRFGYHYVSDSETLV
ncbi:MAG: lipoyl(octanoyl) transferase LipB [Pseudomonadales bacterium]|nr:lipoyl(octanoyl) transferase LipB [Pseudomonadales bacterium]